MHGVTTKINIYYRFAEINLRLTLPYSVRPLCSATIPESIESTGEASPLKHPSNTNMNTDIKFSIYHKLIFSPWCNSPLCEPRPPHYRGFTITLRHTTLGRIPLDE